MQDENKTPRQIERRTILKGAAWSAPVIAAAVAAPAYAASGDDDARIRIYGDCLLSAAGVKIGAGFTVENQGTAAYSETVTVVEEIKLSGLIALPLVRSAVWALLAVEGILSGGSVTRSGWSGNANSTTRSRTVTIAAPLAAGEKRGWGYLLSVTGLLSDLGPLGGISHTATITSPTGNPPVTKSSDKLNWELLSTSC